MRISDHNKYVAFILWLFLTLWVAPAYGTTDTLLDERRIHKFELTNGLQVMIVERHRSPTVALYLAIRAGAVDEEEGKTGTAHMLEHMMFKGTKTIGTKDYAKEYKLLKKIFAVGAALDAEERKGKRSDAATIARLKQQLSSLQRDHRRYVISNEIGRLYTEAGAVNLNASTSHDLTLYHVNLPSNKIELWARIESERMKDGVLREFYEERDVVKEERRQRKESHPDGALYEELMVTAFTRHFYRRPVIGWMEDITKFQPADINRFKKNFYSPNNTTIAVVGDVKTAKLKALIAKYFGSLPRVPIVRPPIPEDPISLCERRVTLAMDANPQIMVGFHKPAPPHLDDYVFDVIETVLADGRASRLYKRLVDDRGLAQSISAQNGLPGVRYDNLFIVSGRPRDGHSTAELEGAIYEILEEMRNNEITEEELTAAKNKIYAQMTRSLMSNEGMAEMLVTYQSLLGDYRYLITYLEAIRKVTAADIRRISSQYFTKTNRVVGIISR